FKPGCLVQIYDSTMDKNHSTLNKLKPRWSAPAMITAKFLNSFTPCTLEGMPLPGKYHANWLRQYIPLRGSSLDYVGPPDEQTPDADAEMDEVTVEEAKD
ncbi:hypothetical protein L208DRAFT_1272146, partial [Tricholoma matsutake]